MINHDKFSLASNFYYQYCVELQLIYFGTKILFSIASIIHIIDIEYPQATCFLNFIVDHFPELFLHPSTFLMKYSRSA